MNRLQFRAAGVARAKATPHAPTFCERRRRLDKVTDSLGLPETATR